MFSTDEIEVLHPDLTRGRFRSVLFDFDGTLSLIREGWPQVMIPMMVDVLRETGSGETDAELSTAVEEFVMRLNGRQTIYQMIQLAEEVRRRGGQPAPQQGLEPGQLLRCSPFSTTRPIEALIASRRSWSLRPEAHNGGRPSSVSALRTARQ